MKIVETLRFPVQAHWSGGRLVRLEVPEHAQVGIRTLSLEPVVA